MIQFCALLAAAVLLPVAWSQSRFDATPPPGVPAVEGAVHEAFALRWIDVAPGSGEPATPGAKYRVHYTGWLRDGKKFDSSRDRNEPFEFVQGRRQVIAGWEAGFEGMRVGGQRRLFIPYAMAYGEKGRGPIPPKAELIFDVELLAVTAAPQVAASAEILDPLKEMESKLMALARAVPEEKYAWRPAPGVRSFGEALVHIANGNRLLVQLASKPERKPEELRPEMEANAKREKEVVAKAAIIELLSASFAEARKALEPLPAGLLGREADFFGRATTVRGVYTELGIHVAEHMGQAIAYARTMGVKPPWSAGE